MDTASSLQRASAGRRIVPILSVESVGANAKIGVSKFAEVMGPRDVVGRALHQLRISGDGMACRCRCTVDPYQRASAPQRAFQGIFFTWWGTYMMDQAKGIANEIAGRAQDAFGAATADAGTQFAGKARQVMGKAQQRYGDAVSGLRDAAINNPLAALAVAGGVGFLLGAIW